MFLKMKPGDRIRLGSDAEVLDGLRELSSRLDTAGSETPVRDKNDYLGFALHHLVAYASAQLRRLASLYSAGIEFHAWTARNLFEACLLCEYLLSDPPKAKEFIAQKASDELRINEGFNDLNLQPVIERNEHIRRALAKHSLPEARYWSVPFLVEKTHNETEYDAFFKLYSKYVHPSAWLVLAAPDEADKPELRNVFLVQAQYYGARILKLTQDFSGPPIRQQDARKEEASMNNV
jgi:hypothetical protein